MPADVVKQPLKRGNAMGHASDVGMHRDRHDAHIVLRLLVEAVKLSLTARQEDIRVMLLQRINRDVIDLDRVGNRGSLAAGRP